MIDKIAFYLLSYLPGHIMAFNRNYAYVTRYPIRRHD